jgi:glycolate oxidase FAD binding subunit
MEIVKPQNETELAATLRDASENAATIHLGGQFSKTRLGGPVAAASVAVSTAALNRVLKFEPRDLTISVEAGMRFAELRSLLTGHKVELPLDPPFASDSTVGGIVAANLNGPRRRLYGTARDMVIGMRFATLDGKLVQSGGMVVKNVAGLDMAKLMIGSFGTLAAIAVVNFKLAPSQPCSATFVLQFATLAEAVAERDRILASALQPAALDLVNESAARRLGFDGSLLLLRAEGCPAVVTRYRAELPSATMLDAAAGVVLWRKVEEFVPGVLAERSDATIVRVSTAIAKLGEVLASLSVPALARAGNGIVYACFASPSDAALWLDTAAARGWKTVVEAASPQAKASLVLWPAPGSDFELMRGVKKLFDPRNLLNPGRLYGRI